MLSTRVSMIRNIAIRRLPYVRYSTITVPTEGDSQAIENAKSVVNVIPTVKELCSSQSPDTGSLIGHLSQRYLLESVTHDELYDLTKPGAKPLKLYCGADPSAQSLHIGNLLPLMVLLHFNLRGHDVVGLVGGATGAVGDPSGRSTERNAMENDTRQSNLANIKAQMHAFLANGAEYAKSRNFPVKKASVDIVNNADWWKEVRLLDFLASFGKHIRVSAMLARDSVQSRLQSKSGIGFNEFTYQVLQAYDFWHLFSNHKVNLQVGGNDQWGNITAGVDLISRIEKKEAYGVTVPLLTTPTGEKFGKSAGNAVFIDKSLTTPFQLYQYFINSPDSIVGKLLKIFTLLPLPTIDEVVAKHTADPGLRIAQRVLAREVVDLVHGVGYGDQMAYVTGFLFPTPDQPFNDVISAEKLVDVLRKSGVLVTIDWKEYDLDDIKMSTLLARVLGKSKRETKALIRGGGIYLGLDREQFVDPEDVVLFDRENHLIEGRLLLVREGKQKYHVVDFTEGSIERSEMRIK